MQNSPKWLGTKPLIFNILWLCFLILEYVRRPTPGADPQAWWEGGHREGGDQCAPPQRRGVLTVANAWQTLWHKSCSLLVVVFCSSYCCGLTDSQLSNAINSLLHYLSFPVEWTFLTNPVYFPLGGVKYTTCFGEMNPKSFPWEFNKEDLKYTCKSQNHIHAPAHVLHYLCGAMFTPRRSSMKIGPPQTLALFKGKYAMKIFRDSRPFTPFFFLQDSVWTPSII